MEFMLHVLAYPSATILLRISVHKLASTVKAGNVKSVETGIIKNSFNISGDLGMTCRKKNIETSY